jgi:hypothetical protein
MSKLATLLLFTIVLVLSSLVVVGFSFAQSIPKPSVPEFTLKYVDNSYDVPPTYGVDQYTGKTVMTQAGYHVENKSIVVTIANQHFSPYEDANGKTLQLYYNIRWKGHFGDYWGDYNSSRRMLLSPYSRFDDEGFPIPNDPFKVATFALGNDTKNSNSVSTIRDVSADGQVDFQVQAYIGYYTVVQGTPVPPFRTPEYHVFTGESSGWSDTQTIHIEESQTPTPSPEPTFSPDPASYNEPQPKDQQVIIGVAVTAVVLGAGLGLLFYLTKRK